MDEGMTVIGDLSRVLAQQGMRPLVEAGAALATLADPCRDEIAIASDLSEAAGELKEAAHELDRARDIADEISVLHPNADEKRDKLLREGRAAAARKAKIALIGLVALLAELDNSLAEPGR